jgi:hypothetical protein
MGKMRLSFIDSDVLYSDALLVMFDCIYIYTILVISPYLGLYNAQDFDQIIYLVGGVRIINRNNVFHSFPDREITCPPCFFCLLLSTCKVKYFLNCLDTIPQNN